MLHSMQRSSTTSSLILPWISTRVRMTLTRLIWFLQLNVFGSIRHTLQASQLLHELEDRSAKRLSVGIDPAGYKGWDLRSNKILDNQFLSTEEHEFTAFGEKSNPHTQSYACKTRILATHLKMYCRRHSCKNASTSTGRTCRHSHKHPGQRG